MKTRTSLHDGSNDVCTPGRMAMETEIGYLRCLEKKMRRLHGDDPCDDGGGCGKRKDQAVEPAFVD